MGEILPIPEVLSWLFPVVLVQRIWLLLNVAKSIFLGHNLEYAEKLKTLQISSLCFLLLILNINLVNTTSLPMPQPESYSSLNVLLPEKQVCYFYTHPHVSIKAWIKCGCDFLPQCDVNCFTPVSQSLSSHLKPSKPHLYSSHLFIHYISDLVCRALTTTVHEVVLIAF